MRLEPGSRLGPYEISAPIGAGGMGEVYRARDTRLGREVAIKVLPGEVTNDRERLSRFEREARSSSALNHRNIVTIHDFTSNGSDAWLVMELIGGESLRDVISRGPLPLKRAIAIAAGVADGLAAAHRTGLVHRDLKPENIMIARDGTPKILDFGLAKNLVTAPDEVTQERSRDGVIVGTAAYMSPEQASGRAVDFHTDQFSFGLVVYEMLTGRNPFRRGSAVETLAAIVSDDAPPLGEPAGWIVERCLQKNPDDRYGSTADLAHDLHRLSAATATSPVRSARASWPLAAAAALVAIAAVSVALIVRPRTTTTAPPPIDAAIATPSIDQIAFGEILPPVAISPDGRFVAIAGVGSDGIDRLWLDDLQSGETRPVAGSEHPHGITFAPDSRSIAFCAGGKIETASIEGGPARAVCDVIPPGQLAWSGDTILFSQPAGIHRVSAGGGAPQNIVPAETSHPADVPMWPEFLPDGRHFLFLATHRYGGNVGHQLMVASLDGGPAKPLGSIESRAIFADGHLLFVRDGTLVAQPFDPKTFALTGEARPLTDDIFYFKSTGLVAAAASSRGLLVWRENRRASREIWLDRTGSATGSMGEAVFSSGRISPDGNRYVASVVEPKQGTGDLWIYDLTQATSQRLTFQSTDDTNPVWAVDGKSVYYRSDALGPPDVFRWKLGDDHGALIYQGPAIEQPEDISPDGKSLLILSYNRAFGRRIYVLALDAADKPRLFSTTPFNDVSPRFSPDGRWVAYESDASGRPEVYVRPFAGGSLPARISSEGGSKPRWRRDGVELFFLGPGGRLMSVPIHEGAATAPPRMLFQANDLTDFEPSVDGSRFLAQLQERSLDPPLHLLVNWRARIEGH